LIFVTVGTQLTFDRLIRSVDQWAGERHPQPDVVAQIGPTKVRPQHIQTHAFVPVKEFNELAKRSEVIVSHAGIGSILTAMRLGKPIVIMPRRASLGEHRNEHQLATAARFRNRQGVFVADDEFALPGILDRVADLRGSVPIESYASPSLIAAVREFIESGKVTRIPDSLAPESLVPAPKSAARQRLQKSHGA